MTANIENVSGLLAAIDSAGLVEQEHAHVRIWFRGHASGTWHLDPGVYRRQFAADETARKLRERHMTQDFQALGAPFLGGPRTDAEIYFIQQHYLMPTRLFDWSLNPLAALYFALDREDEDGTFFLLDA